MEKYIDSEITQYWIHFQAGELKKNHIYPQAMIKCYHEDDFMLQINFYPDAKSVPPNHYDKKKKLVYLRYPMSMYVNIMDILRYEKPIFFRYNLALNVGFVRTGKEPVGEGEYDADF